MGYVARCLAALLLGLFPVLAQAAEPLSLRDISAACTVSKCI